MAARRSSSLGVRYIPVVESRLWPSMGWTSGNCAPCVRIRRESVAELVGVLGIKALVHGDQRGPLLKIATLGRAGAQQHRRRRASLGYQVIKILP
jgi:hypothetical protein